MTAIYDGLQFKTRLEARWAAFFDLAKWEWKVNAMPAADWAPDFRVTFPCTNSQCGGSHTLLVAVLPLEKIEDFGRHPCLSHRYRVGGRYEELHFSVDAGAAFGLSPKTTQWEMSHGDSGGIDDVEDWVPNAQALWVEAGRRVIDVS